MPMIATRNSCRSGLLALACVLATAGCTPGAGSHQATTGRDSATLHLTPDPAFAGARIAVVFGEPAPDRAKCRFEWRRNGGTIDGATTSDLDASQFSKGDRISVLVNLPVLAGAIVPALTAEVRVANSPPRIASVGIETVTTAGGPELQARVACADPDGDSLHFEYKWSRNGAPFEGAHGASASAAGLAHGDRITVSVIAHDDESASPAVACEPFALENRPPTFASQPGALRPGEAAFEYQAVATDPDGDPLRFELLHAPEGMSVDQQGNVRWTLPRDAQRHGEFPVSLRAVDSNGGEAVQEFTIRLGPAQPLSAR